MSMVQLMTFQIDLRLYHEIAIVKPDEKFVSSTSTILRLPACCG